MKYQHVKMTGETKSGNEQRPVIDVSLLVPMLQSLRVQDPSLIQLAVSFEKSGLEVPKMSVFPKMKVDFPKMENLNKQLIPNNFTIDDLSRILHIPRKELYTSIGETEHRLRTRMFDQLEKLVRNSPAAREMLQTIRKKYE